jgi:hypothetical protein
LQQGNLIVWNNSDHSRVALKINGLFFVQFYPLLRFIPDNACFLSRSEGYQLFQVE